MKTKHFLKNGLRLLLVAVSLLSLLSSAMGQELSERQKKRKRDSVINNSEYIFKGSGYGITKFRDDENRVFYVKKIDVSDVIRGSEEFAGKTVYIISTGFGHTFFDDTFSRKSIQTCNELLKSYDDGVNGYFFLKKNIGACKYLKDPVYMEYQYPFEEGAAFFEETSHFGKGIKIWPGCNEYKGMYGMEFTSDSSIYEFLKQYPNITPPASLVKQLENQQKEDEQKQLRLKSGSEADTSKKSGMSREAYRRWLIGDVDLDRYRKKRMKASAGNVDLNFSAENQRTSFDANGNPFYLFDVFVEYSSPDVATVYPDRILLAFRYNTKSFEYNIMANGKLTFEMNESVFPSADYSIDALDNIDNNNEVSILVCAKKTVQENNTWVNRVPIATGQKTHAFTAKIAIKPGILDQTANYTAGIAEAWSSIAMSQGIRNGTNQLYEGAHNLGQFDFFCPESMTFVDFNQSYVLGMPLITSVTPKNRAEFSAGDGCVMQIDGSGFMSGAKGYGGNKIPVVFMLNTEGVKDGNDIRKIPIDPVDILSWTDNRITFKVPSIVYGLGNLINYVSVGTGPVWVRNQLGKMCKSTSEVDVKHSIINTHDAGYASSQVGLLPSVTGKEIPYWARINCSEQIKFLLSDNFFSTVTAKSKGELIKVIQKAFDAWNAVLGRDFLVFDRDGAGNIKRSSYTSSGSISDCVNLIYFASYAGTDVIAGVPTTSIKGAGVAGYVEQCGTEMFRNAIDVFLNKYNIDTYSSDQLQYALMHELGHGLGLDHVNNPDDLMYYKIRNVSPVVSDNSQAGVKSHFNQSSLVNWSCPSNQPEQLFSSNTTCIPEAPVVFKVNATSSNNVHLEWIGDPLATEYIIERDMSGNFNFDVKTFSVKSGYVYNDKSVYSNNLYYYRIKAKNANGTSAYVNSGKITTPALNRGLAPPQRVRTRSIGKGTVYLNLSEGVGANTTPVIERREIEWKGIKNGQEMKTGGEFEVVAVLDPGEDSFVDYGVSEGKSYEYRIKYVDATGYSDYSEPVSVSVGLYEYNSLTLPVNRCALLIKNPYLVTSDKNYNNYTRLVAWAWSHSGQLTYRRTLFDFDFSSIPQDAIITKAELSLQGLDHMNIITEGGSFYKYNASWISRVAQAWDETQVTWNTQPAISAGLHSGIGNSQTHTQNVAADIRELVQYAVAHPEDAHGFMFSLQDETAYARMIYASANYAVAGMDPVLSVEYYVVPEQVLRTNPKKDALVVMSEDPNNTVAADSYYGDYPRVMTEAWTSGELYKKRSLIGFDLSAVPKNAELTEASLSLYSCQPQESPIDRHAYDWSTGATHSNASYLKLITEDWSEHAVSWNNQPATTDDNQVLLAKSTSVQQDYIDINIAPLVQEIVAHPDSLFGLMMQMQNETRYARMSFASSDHPDVSLHPNLRVKYKVYPPGVKAFAAQSIVPENETLVRELDPHGGTAQDSLSAKFDYIVIAPNPTFGDCTVGLFAGDDCIEQISLVNGAGLKQREIIVPENSNSYTIEMNGLAKGMYFLELKTAKGVLFYEKILLQ